MTDAISMSGDNPFTGIWVNDGPSPYKTVIAEEGGKFVVTSEPLLEEGEYLLDNVSEELRCMVVESEKDTLKYVSWHKATRRQAHHTLTATRNKNRLLMTVTYSGTAPITNTSTPNAKSFIVGTWQPVGDDFSSEYTLSMKAGQVQVKGVNRHTREAYAITNVQSQEGVSFSVKTADGRSGQVRFVFEFDDSGVNAFMHFTFSNAEQLRRLN